MNTKATSGSAANGVAGGGGMTAEHNPHDWSAVTFRNPESQLQEGVQGARVTVKSPRLGIDETAL